MGCRRFRLTALLIALVGSSVGCGERLVYPVEGDVLLDGQPLDGATVVFEPDGQGHPAVASTGKDGSFRVTTAEGDGAAPGNYKVTLTKVTGREPDTMPPWIRRDGQPATPAERAAWEQKKADDKAKEKQWVPEVYLKTSTTPFSFRVPVEGRLKLELSGTAATPASK